jgi:hypothetical protein
MRRIILLLLTAALLASCSSRSSTEVVCNRWTVLQSRLANNRPFITMEPQIDDMVDAAAKSHSAELKGLVDDLNEAAASMNRAATIPSEGFQAAFRALSEYCVARRSPSG